MHLLLFVGGADWVVLFDDRTTGLARRAAWVAHGRGVARRALLREHGQRHLQLVLPVGSSSRTGHPDEATDAGADVRLTEDIVMGHLRVVWCDVVGGIVVGVVGGESGK